MNPWGLPVTLSGQSVRLEPLSLAHLDGLCEVGLDPELWRWTPEPVRTREEMRAYVEEAQRREAEGTALGFGIVEIGRPDGAVPGRGMGTGTLSTQGPVPHAHRSLSPPSHAPRVVGSTRLGNMSRENRRVEIGWTWIGRPWQRTRVNTECKYLLLRHAFEVLDCVRVELKTDSLNQASRAAILRIGAREEGLLRNHRVCHDGRLRHTVYYGVTDEEWPAVKRNLETRLSSA